MTCVFRFLVSCNVNTLEEHMSFFRLNDVRVSLIIVRALMLQSQIKVYRRVRIRMSSYFGS
jgi:hypothetical protein